MATGAQLLRAYREQAGLDADEAIALLVDFLATYGMTGSAADALCEAHRTLQHSTCLRKLSTTRWRAATWQRPGTFTSNVWEVEAISH